MKNLLRMLAAVWRERGSLKLLRIVLTILICYPFSRQFRQGLRAELWALSAEIEIRKKKQS